MKGTNEYGALGYGTSTNYIQDSLAQMNTSILGGKTISGVGTNYYAVWVATTDGLLYYTGQNNSNNAASTVYALTQANSNFLPVSTYITSIVGDLDTVLFLTNTGSAYGFGENIYNRIGDNTGFSRYVTPVATQQGSVTFVQLGMGRAHSVGLGSDGLVYTWGYYSAGNTGNAAGSKYPTLIDYSGALQMNQSVSYIATSRDSTVLVTTQGKLYAFGANDFQQFVRDYSVLTFSVFHQWKNDLLPLL